MVHLLLIRNCSSPEDPGSPLPTQELFRHHHPLNPAKVKVVPSALSLSSPQDQHSANIPQE